MRSIYLEKSILFLTDVPYVIFGSGAGTKGISSDIFVNNFVFADNFNIVNTEK